MKKTICVLVLMVAATTRDFQSYPAYQDNLELHSFTAHALT